MSPRQKIALVCALSAVLPATYYAGTLRQSAANKTLADRLERLEAKQGALEAGYLNGVPRAQLAGQLGYSAKASQRQSAAFGGSDQRESVSPEEAARQLQEKLAEMDRAFRAEPVDPKWAGTARQSVETSLVSAAVESDVQPREFSADCRSRSCMISLELASGADMDRMIDMFTTEISGKLPVTKMIPVPGGDGSMKLQILGTQDPGQGGARRPRG